MIYHIYIDADYTKISFDRIQYTDKTYYSQSDIKEISKWHTKYGKINKKNRRLNATKIKLGSYNGISTYDFRHRSSLGPFDVTFRRRKTKKREDFHHGKRGMAI